MAAQGCADVYHLTDRHAPGRQEDPRPADSLASDASLERLHVVTWLSDTLALSEVAAKLVLSAALVAALALVWASAVRIIGRRLDDNPTAAYHARRATTYAVVVLGLLSLVGFWIGAVRNLGTFLGLAAVGIAIALADPLKNIAGWFYILLRRPYRVDDRVEIDGIAGDIIDIRMFHTTLLEIGNWVEADQSTGRLVHVPNGKVLSTSVFNATEGFGYLWHEVAVPITFESDWKRAEQLVLEVLDAFGDHTADAAAARIRQASRAYKIRYTHLTPTVYVSVRNNGVLLTGRLLVETRRRRAADQQVWRGILDAFAAEPSINFAYPTTRTYLAEPIRVDGGGNPAATATQDLEPTGIG